jgi:hypothetical protein
MIKKRTIVIGAIALFILLGSMIALMIYQPEDQSKDKTSLEVTKFPMEEVASLTIENPEGTFTVLTNGETPMIEGEDPTLYSPDGISALANVMTNITAEKAIPAEGSELSNFGLDNPQASLSINLKDGSVVTLHLGMQNPMDQSWAIAKDGDNHVYTVEKVIGNSLLMGKINYRDMSLITGADDTAIRAKVYYQHQADEPAPSGRAAPFEKDAPLAPINGKAHYQQFKWEIVKSQNLDKINDFKPTESWPTSDISEYGLNHPAYT